jgi:hypothetical protein
MRAAILRALLALLVAAASVGLAQGQIGFALVATGIGVRVGVPGASVEFARLVLPIVVTLLFVVLCIRFGIRALRTKATLSGDLARGGKLLLATGWAAWAWLVVELFYRQFWLGGAALFGTLTASLVWSAALVAVCLAVERMLPWSRAPRGVQHLGLGVVVAVGLATALSAWSHRHVVPHLALLPVAIVGLGLLMSGVRRVEDGPRGRMLVELGLASTLLSGPIWSLLT